MFPIAAGWDLGLRNGLNSQHLRKPRSKPTGDVEVVEREEVEPVLAGVPPVDGAGISGEDVLYRRASFI